MKKNERILVVLNPSSGVISKDAATSYIFKTLRRHFTTVSVINSNSPAHGTEIASRGVDQFDIIAAFGGDGTINSVGTALIHTDKTLGIIPGGSGDGLARNLGIPLSWRRALDVLIYGRDVNIDVGKINDKLFFNIAGIGLDGLISKQFNSNTHTRGLVPYIYYALKGCLEMPTFRVQMQMGDIILQDEIMIIAFANFRQYGGKLIIAPFASPYDQLLDVCIINKFKLLRESINLPNLFNGNIHKFPFYKSYKTDRCEIRSMNGDIPFHYDGEYGGKDLSHFKIEIYNARLKVRIPHNHNLI